MIDNHLPRSTANEVEVAAFAISRAVSFIMTIPADGCADHPFCGAEINTSTPVAFMSTQAQPEAMQSKTKIPPTPCTASATALI